VIPWLIVGLIIVPLLFFAFASSRRRTAAYEHPAGEDAQSKAELEQEFADAEAYQEKWREEDKERYHQENIP
jgi:hypothetical protein